FKNDTPTQKQGSSKLVALPDDKQFKDELRSRKTIKASSNETDDFLQKQAEKALAELRKLG
ncbi:hypothetical protein M5X06_32205, partial [Paenibacillus alvei]